MTDHYHHRSMFVTLTSLNKHEMLGIRAEFRSHQPVYIGIYRVYFLPHPSTFIILLAIITAYLSSASIRTFLLMTKAYAVSYIARVPKK